MRPAEEVLAESHKGNFNRGGSGPREGGHRNPPSGGRSSNPYMDALNSASGPAGGKTSNPYASSGGRTANPYYASSGKTPNPLVTGSGTAWGGGTAYGGSTQYNGDTWDSGSQTPALGGATGGADFGAGQDDGGRTSYAGQGYNSAPTPSANWNSQRPSAPPQQANFQSAPTPWGPPQPQSAPTPAAGYGHAAQTPAAPPSAPTPATNQPYSAPTPAAGGSYVNPERARQMASFQPPVDEAPSPAFEPSYESRQPASRHPRDRQQTGSNTGSLGAPNRWGAAKAQQQAYDAPTPAAGAPTPAAPPASAPTPGIFSAPTPGGYSAPTPGAGALGAPTPAPGRLSARTPAVGGSAATPYIPNAYTPAPGASHHDDPLSPVRSEQGLPWDWPKQGMRVRIRPSPDGESFEDGQFDGREARIETANADWESKDVVCSVLLPSHQTLDGFTSPFLEPIRPEFGDNCIVMSGPLRDQMAKCLTHNDDESLIEFTNKSTESVLTYLICAVRFHSFFRALIHSWLIFALCFSSQC